MTFLILVIAVILLISLELILYYFEFISKVRTFNMTASSFNLPMIDIPESLRGKLCLYRRYKEFMKFVHYQEFSLHINCGVDPDEF